MRALKLSRPAFALATIGLGVLGLVYDDFALEWQPVPPGFPWRHGLAYAAGAVLVLGGGALLFKRAAVVGAIGLSGFYLIWALALGAQVASHPTEVVGWLTLGQALLPSLGCALLVNPNLRQAARVLFGLSCVAFGVSHFRYPQATVDVMPPWLPAHAALAYLTGACHAAAGLGLLTGIHSRLAAALETLMLGSFLLVIHLPALGASPAPYWAPNAQSQWTEVLMVLLMTASAGLVADSLLGRNKVVER